jgi:hypothetical protein
MLAANLKRFAVMWFLGGVVTVLVLAAITVATPGNKDWLGYLRLVRGGADAIGTVVRTEPQNHCLAEYTFNVADRSYIGRGPDCSASVDQKIAITYLMADPAHSCLGSARARLQNELATFIVGGILVPPFILFAVRRRRKQEL